MEVVKFIYFDVGYTLVNEDEVWRTRCREQAQTAEARALGLSADDLFSEIVSSWDCKVKKPDRRLFEIAVERAGCSPVEIAMVGDRLDNDIFPANAVGMRTIWIRQGFGGVQTPLSEAYRPTEEVESLEELLTIL